jgi:hypothetical protein
MSSAWQSQAALTRLVWNLAASDRLREQRDGFHEILLDGFCHQNYRDTPLTIARETV